MMNERHVAKRDQTIEKFYSEKLKKRIEHVCKGLQINAEHFYERVLRAMPKNIHSRLIDTEIARLAAANSVDHPDYDKLAVKVFSQMIQKDIPFSFSDAVKEAYTHRYNGERCPLVAKQFYDAVQENKDVLNEKIIFSRDYLLSYFGIRTLYRSYLLKSNDGKQYYEIPQYMFMRVSVGINIGANGKLDVENAVKTYNLMSQLKYTHATPTLFNAGTTRPQLSSCFLLTMQSDSIEGIFDTIKQCAQISKYAGGIGLSTSVIRASGSYIRGTNGHSNGLIPMLRVLNNTSRYVDQGGGKRKGSIAIYIEPWHADIMEFLELKLVTGKEEARARDLFYALWISDLFMHRVRNNEKWSLFCPNIAPGLSDVYGDKFVKLYEQYENEGRYVRQINAQDIWVKIMVSQVETGVPYMCYKDPSNEKSNQKNLGTIRSSNLCTEIVEYSSDKEIAVCNLASISLPVFVDENGCFDYNEFHEVVKVAVVNLNKVIDVNMYPLKEAEYSNLRHRPIGIGVQGLADCFIKMKIIYDCVEGIETDRKIFEVMYHAAVESSCELAMKNGKYETFDGSPASQGLLQFDLWKQTEKVYDNGFYGKDEWEALKTKVKTHGLANSLLIAPMPTATTSQIMGNFTESFSPLPSVLYQRRTLSGDFVLSHPQFVREMIAGGLWTKEMQSKIQQEQGCVENIQEIPETIRRRYRSVWGMSQKWVIDHAAERAPFICQSQSLNIFMADPTTSKLTSMHFYAHGKGLKTGMYYLRSQSKAKTIQFGVEEVCESCSS